MIVIDWLWDRWEALMRRRCAKVGHDLGTRRWYPSERVWRYCYRCGGCFLVHDPNPPTL